MSRNPLPVALSVSAPSALHSSTGDFDLLTGCSARNAKTTQRENTLAAYLRAPLVLRLSGAGKLRIAADRLQEPKLAPRGRRPEYRGRKNEEQGPRMPIAQDLIEVVPIGEENAVTSNLLWKQLGMWSAASIKHKLNEMAEAGLIEQKRVLREGRQTNLYFRLRY